LANKILPLQQREKEKGSTHVQNVLEATDNTRWKEIVEKDHIHV